MFLARWLTAEALDPGNTLNEASAPQDGIALLQLLALQRGCRRCAGDRESVPGILIVLLTAHCTTCLHVLGGNSVATEPL